MIILIMQAHAVICEIVIKCFILFRETYAKTDRLPAAEWLDCERKLMNKKESQEQILGTL
jgi:hypothetical protein